MKTLARVESWLTLEKSVIVSTKPSWGNIRGGAVGKIV